MGTGKSTSPVQELARSLSELRLHAGQPTLNELVELTKEELGEHRGMRRSTIADKLNGKTRPTLDHVLTLVRACVRYAEKKGNPLDASEADLGLWRTRWLAMNRASQMGNAADLQLDAIVVPSARPANELGQAVHLARVTGAVLLVICSGQSIVQEVIRYGGRFGDLKLVVAELHIGGTDLVRLDTRSFSEAVYLRSTDLSDKKNVALLLARMLEWRAILFIDDDIRLGAPEVQSELALLSDYSAVGYRVGGYPDAAVVTHVQLALSDLTGGKGEGRGRSISGGSVLLLNPTAYPLPFFPNIYNEDWLFLYDWIRDARVIVAEGEAIQKPYDPFASIERVASEEFGELVTWGIYSLLREGNDPASANEAFWIDYLQQRQRKLAELTVSVRQIYDSSLRGKMEAALREAERRRQEITPRRLAEYVKKWRLDLECWLERLETIPRFDTVVEALTYLGQTNHIELDKHAVDSRRRRIVDSSVFSSQMEQAVKLGRPYRSGR